MVSLDITLSKVHKFIIQLDDKKISKVKTLETEKLYQKMLEGDDDDDDDEHIKQGGHTCPGR